MREQLKYEWRIVEIIYHTIGIVDIKWNEISSFIKMIYDSILFIYQYFFFHVLELSLIRPELSTFSFVFSDVLAYIHSTVAQMNGKVSVETGKRRENRLTWRGLT